jgi:hypothetical protein
MYSTKTLRDNPSRRYKIYAQIRNKQSIMQPHLAMRQIDRDSPSSPDRQRPTAHFDPAPTRFVDPGVRFERVNLISHVSGSSSVIDPIRGASLALRGHIGDLTYIK